MGKEKMSRLFLLLFVTLAGCAAGSRAPAAWTGPQGPSIVGIVVDSRGEPVLDAIVATEPETDIVTTREDGRFRLVRMKNGASIPSGSYKLIVATDNYQMAKKVEFKYGAGSLKDLGDVRLKLESGIRWEKIRDPRTGIERFVPVGVDPISGQ